MVNTRTEELEFLECIMNDLKLNYPEHDNKTLDEILSIIRFRLTSTHNTIKHKNQSTK